MNKEKLLSYVSQYIEHTCQTKTIILSHVEEFLDSNVCIPKGENRHKDADVYHAYAEGIECEFKHIGAEKWYEFKEPNNYEYRIKPSEPIYEWQWIFLTDGYAEFLRDAKNSNPKFLTLEEAKTYTHTLTRIEETKRVRS